MQKKTKTTMAILLVVGLSLLAFYLALPTAKFEVSCFPTERTYASFEAFSGNSTARYNMINFTFQVRNPGNAAVKDLLVTYRVSPSDKCEVVSTFVFSGNPSLDSLVAIAKDEYRMGVVEPGQACVFTFQVRSTNFNSDTKYVLSVASANAGLFSRELISRGKYGSTINVYRWPPW
ncbi:MAG: hypothetical protein ACE14S_12320 [Candidatus Bathyarchaeia archaeon]